jgi:fimbrial chaperone protein
MLRALLVAVFCLTALIAEAAVRVSPVLIDLRAPASTATLTLKNDDRRTIEVQIRIFRWSQRAGEEHLEPTQDAVVSPPFTALAPNAEYVVRVVRVSPRPVTAEESYRVVVDEIPDRRVKSDGVHFVLRYSIPVFFSPSQAGESRVAWRAEPVAGGIVVSAENTGTRRLRIANLRLVDARGKQLVLREGLVGYVLAGSVMRWSLPGPAVRAGEALRLLAESDARPVDATLKLQPLR